MAGAIDLRLDYTGADLRRLARRCGDADQVRRLLALAAILDGGSLSAAASAGGGNQKSTLTGRSQGLPVGDTRLSVSEYAVERILDERFLLCRALGATQP